MCRNEKKQESMQASRFTIEEEEWETLGLSNGTKSDDLGNNDLAIERNACILEDFLSKALRPNAMLDPASSQNNVPDQLRKEIRHYVSVICSKYHPVGFHSFEHASHVMLSASKLVSMLKVNESGDQFTIYDPWMHFSVCFAALLHDVDHRGVPNQQLASENNPVSIKYCSKEYMGSYAEWNSLELGMDLLEMEEFSLFRKTIDNDRFRSVISDLILCTDIASQERRELCTKRWNEAFSDMGATEICKATGTIADHIMQVADVSHTMQHFETFLKWNQRLYHEVLAAFEYGQKIDATRAHPSENWYESQLSFFDFYIIPLAERLDTSGAFENVDDGLFANLAKKNRARWLEEGKVFTNNMVASTKQITLLPPLTISSHEAGNVSGTSLTALADESDISVCSEDVLLDATSVDQSTIKSEVSIPYTLKSTVTSPNANEWGKIPKLCLRQVVLSLEERVVRGSCKNIKKAAEEYQKFGSMQRHQGALLFVDVSGFTILSQTYPVEDFRTFINEYFSKMIELIASFGGDVVKFAGDALYVIWTTEDVESELNVEQARVSHVERCTACAIAITKECNNYKIRKSYSRREAKSKSDQDSKKKGLEHVRYTIKDKYEEYEDKEAILNVYCGVAEGIMAGVNVVATDDAEFFLIGKPLSDVATAEGLADKGELVISPAASEILRKEGSRIASELKFESIQNNFCKVTWPNCPGTNDILSNFFGVADPPEFKYCNSSLIAEMASGSNARMAKQDEICDANESEGADETDSIETARMNCLDSHQSKEGIQQEVTNLLSCHFHKATRGTIGQFSAELRRVIVIFVKIMYEPSLSTNEAQDAETLSNLQNIFKILAGSVKSRSGQVRQFISDDKGTVFIASFGLRGSMTSNSSASAIAAAQEAQKNLSNALDLQCSIGITRGKIFCGQVGSIERYEYTLLGPTVNLAARFMCAGSPGQINCDEQIMKENEFRYNFVISARHKLKGFKEEVALYMPLGKTGNDDSGKLLVRKREKEDLIHHLIEQQREMTATSKPRAVVVSGRSGTGKRILLHAVLQDMHVQNSITILKGNEFPKKEPFNCWIPVITDIILSCEEIRHRLSKMKKRKKRSPMLNSLLSNDAFQSSKKDKYDDLVPSELSDYLFLINDFVFNGFPLFNTTSRGTVKLRDDERSKKCLEVLTAFVINFIERRGKPCILFLPKLDCIDEYSKSLIQTIFDSSGNLILLGGMTNKVDADDEDNKAYEQIFGPISENKFKEFNLEYLSKESTFDLFLWSIRDLPEADQELLNCPEIIDKIYHICGGMTNLTTELAHSFKIQWNKESKTIPVEKEARKIFLQEILTETPSAIEDLVCFRFDQLNDGAQMILKIASCAAYNGYSFSQDLLESVVLSISKKQENDNGLRNVIDDADEIDVPQNVGLVQDMNELNSIFQGDCFEQIVESLVEQKFLDEQVTDVSDLASLDSFMYRFQNMADQAIVNGLMLDDQKKMIHFEIARYYCIMFSEKQISGDEGQSEEGSALLSNSDMTSLPSSSWQRLHITALHYDLADAPVPAMLSYFDSAIELESLCIRDHSHGSLLSAYLMFKKLIHQHSSLDCAIDEKSLFRQCISKQIISKMGDTKLPEAFHSLTYQHLKVMFENDAFILEKCITMLIKFGQSVGAMESDGFQFAVEIQFQAVYLFLQVLEDKAFKSLIASLSSVIEIDATVDRFEAQREENTFFIEDLTLCFPAFSAIMTNYRDSSSADVITKEQETFTVNLFVAVTEEAKEITHLLRTKCTLLYLYKKHGEINKALAESETVKKIYDHDRYSLDIARTYGLDWPLICVTSMIAVYICRGELSAAYHSINFINCQLEQIDEFASSTKAIVKTWISSFYSLLYDFDNAAKAADGLSNLSYPYFMKLSGILQDVRAQKQRDIYTRTANSDFVVSDDQELLSILSSDELCKINHSRGMLYQSMETQCDRGIESFKAELCLNEIKAIQKLSFTAENKKKQLEYCQAGLAYLEQSLQQKEAKNHDRLTNYSVCLLQKAELLYWHRSISQILSDEQSEIVMKDFLNLDGSEMDVARACLHDCKVFCDKYELFLRLMTVGSMYIYLGLDVALGVKITLSSVFSIKSKKSHSDYLYALDHLIRMRRVLRRFYRQENRG